MRRIAPMEVTCATCGKVFLRVHGRFPRYCSTSCGAVTGKTVAERLAEMSKQSENGCIEWQRSTTASGYGQISINKVPMRAHRVAYELVHGPIPDGMFVCHRCDNPKCINVDHLFLGTNKENVGDAVSKRRMRHGDSHPTTRFSSADVKTIRELRLAGKRVAEIWRMFPGSKYITVYEIASGRSRKYG